LPLQHVGAGGARARITRQGAREDLVEHRRKAAAPGAGRRGVHVHERTPEALAAAVVEPHAGGHLVEQHAQHEHVGAPVGGLAAQDLLGGHVARRASPVAAGGVQVRARHRAPEVHEARQAVAAQHHVLGREVAVHQLAALAVGVGELVHVVHGRAELADHRQRERHGQRRGALALGLHDPLERGPGNELERDEPGARLRVALQVVHVRDAALTKARQQQRLTLEGPERARLRGERIFQALDQHLADEASVSVLERGIGIAQVIVAESANELVAAEPLFHWRSS
jgi:hypothetical protein